MVIGYSMLNNKKTKQVAFKTKNSVCSGLLRGVSFFHHWLYSWYENTARTMALAPLDEFSEVPFFREVFFGYWPFSEKITASGTDLAPLENFQGISSLETTYSLGHWPMYRKSPSEACHCAQALFSLLNNRWKFWYSFLELSLVNQQGKRNKVHKISNSSRSNEDCLWLFGVLQITLYWRL